MCLVATKAFNMEKLLFPIDGYYRLTQSFGEKIIDYTGITPSGKHDGIDYACYRGTKTVASAKALIVETYNLAKPDKKGYGNMVRMLIKTDLENTYLDFVIGHLLAVFVKPGDCVERGQLVALSDNTGMSTGDHEHLAGRLVTEMYQGSGTFRTYLGKNYLIENYDNGYFGYIDISSYFKDTPQEMLASDLRYGRPVASSSLVWLWKQKNEAYAKKRLASANIGLKYDERVFNALYYGYWDIGFLCDISNFPIWVEMTKPAWLKIKGQAGGANLTTINDRG